MKKLISGHDRYFPWALHPTHLYEYGIECGIPAAKLLENTGLTVASLDDIDLRISWEQYKDLAVNVGHYGSTTWGLELGARLDISSHGLLSLLVMNCETWVEILDLLRQYPVLVSPIFYIETRETSEYVYVCIHPEFTRHVILERSLETLLVMTYRSFLQLCGDSIIGNLNDIAIFTHVQEPNHSAEFCELTNENVTWGYHTDYIRFKKTMLNIEVPNANPVTARSTKRMLQAQLNQLPALKGGLNELRSLFKQRIYRQEECAEALLTTLPTLKRYLKNAHTTFSRELSLYRIEEACWAAENTNIEAAQLSDNLGFQDVNSFGRLFKKEMGLTFNKYREHCRESKR